MILETLRNGLLRYARNDGSQKLLRRFAPRNDEQLSLRATKSRGNPFLILITLIIFCFCPCQAAIELDGVNDYINLGDVADLNSTNRYTISYWFRTANINRQYVIDKQNATAGGYYSIIDLPNIIFPAPNGITWNEIPINAGLLINTWYHATGTWNGSELKHFIDGNLLATTPLTATLIDSADNLNIGRHNLGAMYFQGQLEDIRIYDRDLSATEVQVLYNSRSKRPSGSLANGLVAHYEMDDDAIGEVAAQAKDSSGNLNDGQFIGFNNLTTALSKDVPAQIGTGTSLEFDGVNDYISTYAITNSVVSANNYSMSIWIKPSGIAPTVPINQTWLAGILGDSGGYFSIGRANITGEGDRVYTYNYPGIDRHVSAAYNIDEWTHLLTVQNGGNLKFYKDNNFIGSIASSGPSALPGNILIGRVGSLVYHEFTGSIDDARIYNRPLMPSEISFLYNGSGLDPGTSNLQALWTFDDDSALKDSSGNDNHGVGVGGNSLKFTKGVLRR